MPVETLTKNLVKDSICPSGKHKVDIHDSGCKGLLLEVRATGGKTYYFRYRDDRSKVRQMRIGAEDTLTLKQARTLCDRHRSKLAMGEDPWATKAELRRVPKLETFIYESFLPFIKTYKRSWDTDQSLLKNHIVPTFGHLYMDQLNKKHVIDFIGKHIRLTRPAASTESPSCCGISTTAPFGGRLRALPRTRQTTFHCLKRTTRRSDSCRRKKQRNYSVQSRSRPTKCCSTSCLC